MNQIAGLIVPFFGLILIGYGAGRLDFVKSDGVAALNFFVLYLAMPALFFQLVAATPLSEFQGASFLLATTFSTYCAFAIAFSVGALTNGGNVSEATIQGLIGSGFLRYSTAHLGCTFSPSPTTLGGTYVFISMNSSMRGLTSSSNIWHPRQLRSVTISSPAWPIRRSLDAATRYRSGNGWL